MILWIALYWFSFFISSPYFSFCKCRSNTWLCSGLTLDSLRLLLGVTPSGVPVQLTLNLPNALPASSLTAVLVLQPHSRQYIQLHCRALFCSLRFSRKTGMQSLEVPLVHVSTSKDEYPDSLSWDHMPILILFHGFLFLISKRNESILDSFRWTC